MFYRLAVCKDGLNYDRCAEWFGLPGRDEIRNTVEQFLTGIEDRECIDWQISDSMGHSCLQGRLRRTEHIYPGE